MSSELFPIKICAVVIIFGGVVLGALTGCVDHRHRTESVVMYPVEPVVQTTFVIEDDYIYYPSYQVYYSNRRHQYAYRDGRNWVSRPSPHGVTVNQLRATPSVRMEFHDSPEKHHETVTRQYPQDWSPTRANPERKENRNEDQRDKRNNNQH